MTTPASATQLQHRAVPAVQRMLEYAPASGSLALWVQHRDVPADDEETPVFGRTRRPPRPAVTTDGSHLYYARSFDALTIEQQTGWVAHGVLHIALRHVPRLQALRRTGVDVDAELFNLCADAIVNSALSHHGWLALPKGGVTLEQLLKEVLGIETTAEAALAQWDVERLYRLIDDRRPLTERERWYLTRQQREKAGKDGGRKDGGGASAQRADRGAGESASDEEAQRDARLPRRIDGPRASRLRVLAVDALRDLVPSDDARSAPEDEAELARDWSERLLRAQAGDGAMSLLRVLPADVPRTRTPWEQVLRRHLARGLSRTPGLSWSRPARSYLANQGRTHRGQRLPFEPGHTTARNVPRLALVVDVSGSVDAALLARFATEIAAITRRQESACVVVIGDAAVQQVAHCAPGELSLADLKPRGGGGTDFTPLLEEADRHRPDAIVVLTDLDGPIRYKPRAPVLWAVPNGGDGAIAPFGRLVGLR